jgi:hypothetical protein
MDSKQTAAVAFTHQLLTELAEEITDNEREAIRTVVRVAFEFWDLLSNDSPSVESIDWLNDSIIASVDEATTIRQLFATLAGSNVPSQTWSLPCNWAELRQRVETLFDEMHQRGTIQQRVLHLLEVVCLEFALLGATFLWIHGREKPESRP